MQRIWLELQKAVSSVRPDLADEFALCKDKASIVAFLNEKLPLDASVKNPDWNEHLMLKVPDVIREKEKNWLADNPPPVKPPDVIVPDPPDDDEIIK
jgi:hypothetical protein